MRFQFVLEKMAQFPIGAMCRALQVSRSGFYAWKGRPPSARDRDNQRLVLEVQTAYEAGRGAYGSPRVAAELRAQGRLISTKRVARVMRENCLKGRKRRRFKTTTDSRNTRQVAGNLLARNFHQNQPNKVWVTDVTAVQTGTGWLYLAAIIDLFSRTVVSWSTSTKNDTALALEALGRAFSARKPPPGLIHHSDRGSPYGSHDYRQRLSALQMIPSMSRKGDCWDNSVAESFFASRKGEHLDHDWYPSQASARRAIEDYIDNFYNPLRRHSTLGNISPIEFELRAQSMTC